MRATMQSKPLKLPITPLCVFALIFLDKEYFFFTKVTFFQNNGFPSHLMMWTVSTQDIGVLAVIAVLCLLADRFQRAKLLAYAAVVLLLLFYYLDSQLFQSLFERLTVAKLYEFADDTAAITSFVTAKKLVTLGVILLSCLLTWGKYVRIPMARSRPLSLVLIVSAGVPYLNLSGRAFDVFFDGYTANMLRINQGQILQQKVSHAAVENTRQHFPELATRFDDYYEGRLPSNCPGHPFPTDTTSPHRQPNVIVLLSESLSQVDSKGSGGVLDRLPKIDQVFRSRGLLMRNVVANGSGTADALAALLLGIEPLPTTFRKNQLLQRFPPLCEAAMTAANSGNTTRCERNLACRARQNGYKTMFPTVSG